MKDYMKNTIIIFLGNCLTVVASAAPQMKSIEVKNLLTDVKVQVDSKDKKGLVVVFLKEFNFVAVHSNVDEGKELSKPYFEKDLSLPFGFENSRSKCLPLVAEK